MEKSSNNKKSGKRDQYTVVLEDLRGQFKVFGEALSVVDKKIDRNTEMTGQIMVDVEQLKMDVAEIKHDLKQKVGRDEFARLEKRVLMLERHRTR